MNDANFSPFLQRSLSLLDGEAPAAYAAVVASLGGRSVNIAVDDERLALLARRGRLVISAPLEHPTTSARTSRRALRRLLEGEVDLTRAILADEVALFGGVDDLTNLYDALLCYFRGAVRSPSFPALLDDFLGPPGDSSPIVQAPP